MYINVTYNSKAKLLWSYTYMICESLLALERGYKYILLRCMPGIVERIASSKHQMLPRDSRDPKLLVGLQDFSGFNYICVSPAIRHRYEDRISIVYILKHLKVVSVPMTVHHTHAFLPRLG